MCGNSSWHCLTQDIVPKHTFALLLARAHSVTREVRTLVLPGVSSVRTLVFAFKHSEPPVCKLVKLTSKTNLSSLERVELPVSSYRKTPLTRFAQPILVPLWKLCEEFQVVKRRSGAQKWSRLLSFQLKTTLSLFPKNKKRPCDLRCEKSTETCMVRIFAFHLAWC